MNQIFQFYISPVIYGKSLLCNPFAQIYIPASLVYFQIKRQMSVPEYIKIKMPGLLHFTAILKQPFLFFS